MNAIRLSPRTSVLFSACLLVHLSLFSQVGLAQSRVEAEVRPDVRRALKLRTHESVVGKRKDGYTPAQSKATLPRRPLTHTKDEAEANTLSRIQEKRPARLRRRKT